MFQAYFAERTSAVIHTLVKRSHVDPQSVYCEAFGVMVIKEYFGLLKQARQALRIHTFNVQKQTRIRLT